MSNWRALTIQSGVHKQQQDADTLVVGAGITTLSGDLNLSSNTGNLVITAGELLKTSGSGNIDLPNNGSARFEIEGVNVSTNVTAANLGTLTAGSSSIADALHTHLVTPITGLTTSGLTAGQAVYVSGASTVLATDNATSPKAFCVGVYDGTSGQILRSGSYVSDAQFTTAGGSPANGSVIYLAAAADDTATGAGKFTATAPATAGSFVALVGVCLDNANYAGAKTAKIIFMVTTVTQL